MRYMDHMQSHRPTFSASACSSLCPAVARSPYCYRSMLVMRTGLTITPTEVERMEGSSNSTSAPVSRVHTVPGASSWLQNTAGQLWHCTSGILG